MVGIFDALRRIWETCQREWRQETSTKGFVQEMVDSISLNWGDFAYFLLIGILVTLFRQELNRRLLQVKNLFLPVVSVDVQHYCISIVAPSCGLGH